MYEKFSVWPGFVRIYPPPCVGLKQPKGCVSGAYKKFLPAET